MAIIRVWPPGDPAVVALGGEIQSLMAWAEALVVNEGRVINVTPGSCPRREASYQRFTDTDVDNSYVLSTSPYCYSLS